MKAAWRLLQFSWGGSLFVQAATTRMAPVCCRNDPIYVKAPEALLWFSLPQRFEAVVPAACYYESAADPKCLLCTGPAYDSFFHFHCRRRSSLQTAPGAYLLSRYSLGSVLISRDTLAPLCSCCSSSLLGEGCSIMHSAGTMVYKNMLFQPFSPTRRRSAVNRAPIRQAVDLFGPAGQNTGGGYAVAAVFGQHSLPPAWPAAGRLPPLGTGL